MCLPQRHCAAQTKHVLIFCRTACHKPIVNKFVCLSRSVLTTEHILCFNRKASATSTRTACQFNSCANTLTCTDYRELCGTEGKCNSAHWLLSEKVAALACLTRTRTSETLSLGVPSVPLGGLHSATGTGTCSATIVGVAVQISFCRMTPEARHGADLCGISVHLPRLAIPLPLKITQRPND